MTLLRSALAVIGVRSMRLNRTRGWSNAIGLLLACQDPRSTVAEKAG